MTDSRKTVIRLHSFVRVGVLVHDRSVEPICMHLADQLSRLSAILFPGRLTMFTLDFQQRVARLPEILQDLQLFWKISLPVDVDPLFQTRQQPRHSVRHVGSSAVKVDVYRIGMRFRVRVTGRR